MPTILVILVALAGFSVSFGLGNFIAWYLAGRDRAAAAFGFVCLFFAGYVSLQVAILTSSELGTTAGLLRAQGAVAGLLFVATVYFGAAFVGRQPDWFDRVVASAYVALGVWSLASPAGYWFAELTVLEPTSLSGGVIYHPRGPLAWTYSVSIALQYPLFLRLLVSGIAMIRRGARFDGWLWTVSIGVVVASLTHDHLVDLGWAQPPYLGEYSFPLFIAAVAIRNSIHRNREHVRLQALQASLAHSEARFRDLYEGSTDAIFVHDAETGAILDVNQTMCAMYGYPRDRCSELTAADLSAPGFEFTEERALERIAEAQAQGKTSFPWHARRADGTTFPVEVTLKSTEVGGRDCVVATVRDVTERQIAAEALRQGEARYRSLFEGAGDAIVILSSEEMVFVDCNPEALRLFNCERRHDLLAHSPADFSPPTQPNGATSREAVVARVRAASAGEPQRFEWMHQRRDGSSFLADVNLVAIDLDGKPHLQGIVRDVTEQRRLDERLQQAQRLESIGQLAGGVAHDFNNLLMPIIGHVELLLDELPSSDPMREQLEEVYAAAQRAQRLTRQLLTFGRKAVLDVRALDLEQLLCEMQGLVRKLLREDIELQLEIEARGAVVRADPSQLEQLLMNLAVNARDAMPRGGLLSLRLRRQVLDAEDVREHGAEPGEYAVLVVSDTGVGMTPEVQSRIFEPFFTTKEASRGTGLGLATVFGVVRQHGGLVRVYSELGVGTSFRVYLPLVNAAVSSTAGSVREDARGTEAVLVVEDDDSVRRLACRVLRKAGYRVEEYSSPDAAIEAFDSLPVSPQLLLTDVVMPGTNGRALYETLRERAPSLRVLYMSGYSGDVISHHGVLEPGVALIEKPFAAKELVARVRAGLDQT